MSDYKYQVEYKQPYLKGYLPIKNLFKKKYQKDITPNEYYQKYVTRISDEEDTYDRVPNIEENKTYLYRMVDGYKYLIGIIPYVK